MRHILETLRTRNELLYYFGLLCLLAALVCLLLVWLSRTQVQGVSAWVKPFKFFMSTTLFVWSMAWFTGYLPNRTTVGWYAWGLVVLFSLELVYITIQAARGQLSHFNVSTPLLRTMWSLMALAAVGISVLTAYITTYFFRSDFPQLPPAYLWGIRLGLVLFVLFSMQGLAMGARMAHTVGGTDGGPGLPVVNWSTRYGDLRIAHFLGMHALQVIPLVAYYVLQDVRQVIIVALLYGALTLWIFVQALQGRPLIGSFFSLTT